MYDHLTLFSGRAHPALTREISDYLGIKLGAIELADFPDGEISVKLEQNIRGCDVFLVQPTGPPVNKNLMELLIMIDACKRASAARITAVIQTNLIMVLTYATKVLSDLSAKYRDFGSWLFPPPRIRKTPTE